MSVMGLLHYRPLPLAPLSHSWDNSWQYGKTPKLLMVSVREGDTSMALTCSHSSVDTMKSSHSWLGQELYGQ